MVKRALKQRDTLAKASGHRQKVWSEAKVKPRSPPKEGKAWQNQALSVIIEGVCIFNYEVNCHRIKLRLNSAIIFTVTATSEGLFAPLEGCLCLLGVIGIGLHSFFAQYFEPSIVYISSFVGDIPLWQSEKHHEANSAGCSIL